MSKKLSKPKNKKFLGAALAIGSIAVSAASSAYSAKQQKKQQKKLENDQSDAEEAARLQVLNQKHINDVTNAEEYRKLYDTADTYKHGGQVKNSTLKPIGKGMYKADGPTHKQGGINIGNNMNIEGGEIVQTKGNNVRVYSKEPIAAGVRPGSVINENTPSKVSDAIFNNQELTKKKLGYNDDGTKVKGNISSTGKAKKAKLGATEWSTIGSAGASLASGITNLVSAATATAPRKIKPVLARSPNINTDISTSAERTAVDRTTDRINRYVDENTGSSQVGLARKQQAEIEGRDAKNRILETEKNAERSLQNQKNQIDAATSANNANTINRANEQNINNEYQYNVRKAQNVSGALASIGNAASSVGRYYANSQNQKQFENKQLSTILATDTNNSSISMIESGSFDNYFGDEASVISSINAAEAQGNLALATALRNRYRQVTGKDI